MVNVNELKQTARKKLIVEPMEKLDEYTFQLQEAIAELRARVHMEVKGGWDALVGTVEDLEAQALEFGEDSIKTATSAETTMINASERAARLAKRKASGLKNGVSDLAVEASSTVKARPSSRGETGRLDFAAINTEKTTAKAAVEESGIRIMSASQTVKTSA